MVRYARVQGSNTKSSFNRVPEEATSWSDLKAGGGGSEDAAEDEAPQQNDTNVDKKQNVKKTAVWSEFEPEKTEEVGEKVKEKKKKKKKNKKLRVEKEQEGVEFKRRKLISDDVCLSVDGEEVKLTKFDGYLVTESDAQKLTALREKLTKAGEDEKKIYALVKMERRKAERFVKLKKKNLCFHCRKGGHNLSDCPELTQQAVPVGPSSGICFKCGSTEHRLPQCKSKSTTLEFATCFTCGQSGHLSKNCSNNPRGLYPDGGSCKSCGDVTHYERDCPVLMNKKKKARQNEFISAKTIDRNNIEALDYEEEFEASKRPTKITVGKKGPNKIIKF